MTFTGKFWAKISPEPVYQSSFLTKLWAKTDVSAKKNFKLRSIGQGKWKKLIWAKKFPKVVHLYPSRSQFREYINEFII